MNKCTKIIEFFGPAFPCNKSAVLQVNEDFACEEHAPELAQLSDIEWPMQEQRQNNQVLTDNQHS